MTALSIIGLIVLFVLCLYASVAAFGAVMITAGFGGKVDALAWVLVAVAVALWTLFFYLQPYRLELVK